MVKLKFPGGIVGNELRKTMLMDDKYGIIERPEVVQNMEPKCKPGKIAQFTVEEIKQLHDEADNLLDKLTAGREEDLEHLDWTLKHTFQVRAFRNKLKSLI